jgi:hypothetical protein
MALETSRVSVGGVMTVIDERAVATERTLADLSRRLESYLGNDAPRI